MVQEITTKQIIALSKEIEVHKSNIAVISQKSVSLTDKISSLEQSKAAILDQISSFANEFEQLCHGYASAEDKINKVLAAKTATEAELKKVTESAKSATIKLMECQKNLSVAQNSLSLLAGSISTQNTILKDVFDHFNTTSIDAILSNILPNSKEIELEIEAYDKEKSLMEHEFEKCKKPENLDSTDYKQLTDNIKTEINETTLLLGSLLEQIEYKQKDLQTQNKLNEELEKDKQNLSVATKLCSLLRGKELLAFATEAYLQDITERASTKLFSLLSDG